MENYDAIIIGAGTAGLCVAALLANAGYKSLVLEKQKWVGGRARVVHKNGFIVDYGVHTLRGNYRKVFHPLGMELHKLRLPFLKGIILEDRGILHKLPKISSLIRAKTLKIKDINLLLRHLGRLTLFKPQKYFNISIKQWLDGIGADQRLIRLFRVLSMIILVCPFLERASLGEFLLTARHFLTGLGHPKGGFRQIHQCLIWKIRKCGGIIQTEQKVDEIIVENGRAVGVRIAGKEIRSKIVVSSLPVQKLHTIIDESLLEEKYSTLIKNLRPTAGISVDYGLKEKVYKEVMFLVSNPDVMGSFTSNIDPITAPKGKQLVTFFNPLNVEDVKNREKAKGKLNLLEKKIFSMFPKLSNKIEWKRTLFLEMVDGVELNINQTQDKRPDVEVPNISNLFIASDSTRAEGAGGDIAFSSARMCFDRIVQTQSRNF
ncbi:MAG: NAD(P)/FAD-dependent oxidoreductase [Candidatus Helarchaeota archaeon]|nr:NAD(P)/FAD-dependent oxidoreductase [Candidatus Helarchaeota archaeon]